MNRKRKKLVVALLMALLILSLACVGLVVGKRTRAQTTESVARSYMADTYGEPDRTGRLYGIKDVSDLAGVQASRICALQEVRVNQVRHILLGACKFDASESSESEPNSIDLAVLRVNSEGKIDMAAKLDDALEGTGDIHLQPPEIVRLGANFFGFRIKSIYFAMGSNIEVDNLYAPGPAGLKKVFGVALHADNAGSDCGEVATAEQPACVQLDRTYKIDSVASTAAVYPIIVAESNPRNPQGTPLKFMFRFDLRHWQYLGPRGFDTEPAF